METVNPPLDIKIVPHAFFFCTYQLDAIQSMLFILCFWGHGTMLRAGKVAGSIPDEVIRFFNWPNPSSRTTALESTQPITEMSTRNLLVGKERPAPKADKLTAICEPIFYKMWEPRRFTTLWACYRGSFTFYTVLLNKPQLVHFAYNLLGLYQYFKLSGLCIYFFLQICSLSLNLSQIFIQVHILLKWNHLAEL
jgi:hypothetical protein